MAETERAESKAPGRLEALQERVEKAAALVEQEGTKAFEQFNKKDSEWFHGNTYVFVDSLEGEFLCYPPMPSEVGKNIVNFKDADGREVFKLEIAKVTSENTVPTTAARQLTTPMSLPRGHVSAAFLSACFELLVAALALSPDEVIGAVAPADEVSFLDTGIPYER